MGSNNNISQWRGSTTILFWIIYTIQLLYVGARIGALPETEDEISLQSKSKHTPPVRLISTSKKVVMENGKVEVTLAAPEGLVTGIRYGGLDNLLDASNKDSNRGYWDISSTTKVDGDNTAQLRLVGASFKIISYSDDMAEISFVAPPTQLIPLHVDHRYVMLRGSSGFYSYSIFERPLGLPPLRIDQIRTVFKLDSGKFRYMAVSDRIQRIMPTPQDRINGQPLAFKEAVLLTNSTNHRLRGEVDDKYQYSCEDKDNKLHGWISFDPPVGVWIITPTDEFRMGGPHKQDLTAHVGPTLLAMLHSTHYAGKNLSMIFKSGEPWNKVFGPYFVHLNSFTPKADPRTLWTSAKAQMVEEVNKWPYSFPSSNDFPKANLRGLVKGRLLVNDSSKVAIPAAYAWVGLAAPGEVGWWQHEVKGYQFWTKADANGSFVIKNVRAGKYSLYGWAPGFIGDYKYSQDIAIIPGKQIEMGEVVYMPPRNGPTLWEIGFPDRTAQEFFIPDPNPKFINRLFIHDNTSDKYRQYGLWDRYTDLYPKQDLIYTVGASDFRKDWFYAHVLRKSGDTYKPTTWQIRFSLTQIAPNTTYTLQIALASAAQAELQVRINSPDLNARPVFTTKLIGNDNAIARHGIHGLYKLYSIQVSSSLLNHGDNIIYLTQSRGIQFYRGVMYDYLRLEGPSSPI